MRCFVGFFGITRGLQWTIDSIERNVFAPLDHAGFDQVRAGHFNLPQFLDAPRSGEHRVPFEMGDIGRLKLDRQIIEPQLLSNISSPLDIVLGVPFWNEADIDGSIRRNAMHQLYSLSRLGRILNEMEPASYDIILLLRPDLRYLDPLPILQFVAQLRQRKLNLRPNMGSAIQYIRRHGRERADIIIPSWHRWGGLNDRLAAATPAAASIYMNRINCLAEFCAERSYFHPESLLEFALRGSGMTTMPTWVRAQRVRSDGSIPSGDLPGRKDRLRMAIMHPLRRLIQI